MSKTWFTSALIAATLLAGAGPKTLRRSCTPAPASPTAAAEDPGHLAALPAPLPPTLAAGLRPGPRRAGSALADRDAVHKDRRYLVGDLGRRLTARLAPGGLERQVERADERQEQDVRADAGTDCALAAGPLD